MPPIEARVKDLLDETRLAMLGTQLLLGLQYRAVFSARFTRLPQALQMLDCLALLCILATAGLLLATPCFHQIAEGGHATERLVRRASKGLEVALLPLTVALGSGVAIAFQPHAGAMVAAIAGGTFVLAAILIWYGVPACSPLRRKPREDLMQDRQQSLEARIVQALTELRVVLPGAQALFGFQVSAVLTERFADISEVSQAVHLASTGLVVIAIILLLAPASYHRIAASGEAEESVLRYTVRMMLPAEGLIAVALIGDAYVTLRMVIGDAVMAAVLSGAAAVGFALLLYGLPIAARMRKQRRTLMAAG